LESTKDIVYEYIVVIKKGIDKTKEVVEICKKKWNLNLKIIESELKLREARKLAFEISKNYADYYLIQDGDEIYFTTDELRQSKRKTIIDLINENYDHCETSMIYLRHDLLSTQSNLTWLIPHPFLIKNLPEIFWPNKGDLPYLKYDWSIRKYKLFNTGEKNTPFKFDCNVKNFRRLFLREVFTNWHDSDHDGTIESYALSHHPSVINYKNKINENENDIEVIINHFNNNVNQGIPYNENQFNVYPKIIKKYIELNLIKGIENLEDLDKI